MRQTRSGSWWFAYAGEAAFVSRDRGSTWGRPRGAAGWAAGAGAAPHPSRLRIIVRLDGPGGTKDGMAARAAPPLCARRAPRRDECGETGAQRREVGGMRHRRMYPLPDGGAGAPLPCIELPARPGSAGRALSLGPKRLTLKCPLALADIC